MIGRIISHYKILDRLGEGGMGVVYRAEDTKLKRTVALKFIITQVLRKEEEKTRFVREAQAAASLNHPNINTIYEIDEVEDRTFIAMEYVDGQTLKEKIKSGPLKLEEVLEIGMQVADGLREAHEKGIVHRDIKSSNIMVTENGQAKIMDFGLAKLVGGTKITKTATVMGTVAYMSPEQAYGESMDFHTDMWSFGVVFYEMLTGQLPFAREYNQLVLYSILNENPQPITSLRSGVPLELERIINKCLEKDPTERFQSAADLKADLKRLKREMSTGQVVFPSTATAIARPTSRLLRKIAVPFAVVGIVLILLLLFPNIRHSLEKYLGFGTKKHIAILPFTVVGGDSEDRAFCDGLVGSLTRKLARIEEFEKSLWVIPADEPPRRGVNTASDAWRVFKVSVVVTGTLQRMGDVVRLTLNLVDTRTLSTLDSKTINEHIANVSVFQEDLVKELAMMLDINIKPQILDILTDGLTSVPGAYESYMKGCGYLQNYKIESNLDTAINMFNKAIEQDSLYALAYAGLGESYWRKYKITEDPKWIEKAQSYCEKGIQLNNHLAPIHVALGIIYKDKDRYEDAIKEFLQALKLDPVNPDVYLSLARVYEDDGKFVEAEETYKKAIECNRDYWEGYDSLGYFYYYNGRYSEAEIMFRKVTELMPVDSSAFSNLGAIYAYLEQKELAAEMFEKSIAIEPNANAYSNLGTIYFYLRRYADAMAQYEQAIKLGKNNPTIYGNLGDTYRFTPGYEEKAPEAYQRAIKLAKQELIIYPKDGELHGRLARYYALTGDYKNAVAEAYKARELGKNNSRVLFACIMAFEIANQREHAIKMLQEYLECGGSIEKVLKEVDLDRLRVDPRYKQLIAR